jgi:hypothetical protein
LSVVPGRERVFYVSKELTNMDDMLAGVMYYKKDARIYLGPSETASISHAGSAKLKLFHLIVPRVADR